MRRLLAALTLLATCGCASSGPPAPKADAALSDQEREWLKVGPDTASTQRQASSPNPTSGRRGPDLVRTALVAAAKASDSEQANCAKHADAKGMVEIAFAIDEAGRVSKARVVYDDIESAELDECLLRLVETWTIGPTAEGLPTSVVYDFSFASGGANATTSKAHTVDSLVTKMPQGIKMEPCCVPKELVQREVSTHVGLIQRCYVRELATDPTLAGRVTLEWTISAAGDVENPRVREATLKSDRAIGCMTRALTAMAYPAMEKPTVVSYPFNFASIGMGTKAVHTEGDAVKPWINRYAGDISRCHAQYPDVDGRLVLQWIVDSDGSVKKGSMRVVENQLGEKGIAKCLLSALSTWRFPVPANGTTAFVTFPFRFKNQNL